MNKNIKSNSPLIFTKKINNQHKIIPLNLTVNTLGSIKHFPPATREWFNSIYAYNNNTMKNLSIADKNLSRLIKSYFNFYFSKNMLKSKRIAMRFRRLAMKKIFVSKAEVKHTSNKVIITLYVYNEEKRFLLRRIKKLTSVLFPSRKLLDYLFYKTKKARPDHFIESFNDVLNIYYKTSVLVWFTNYAFNKFQVLINQRDKFANINMRMFSSIKKKLLGNIHKKELKKKDKNKYKKIYKNISKLSITAKLRIIKILQEKNILKRKTSLKGMEALINYSIFITKTFSSLLNRKNISLSIQQLYEFLSYLDKYYIGHLISVKFNKEYKVIRYYKLLLNLNKAKFKDFFILRLSSLVSKIYGGKDVQFNIVNLKNLYFNSDIFTQAISIKLKNRDNRLIRVLRSALFLVKLPKVNTIKERYHKTILKHVWGNKVKNFKVSYLSNNTIMPIKYKKDIIDSILFKLYDNSSFISINEKKTVNTNLNKSLLDFILSSLKHKKMAGVRLEAKGRLTRRFTASRSVFKLRWKGGIRNIDSSYRGLSTVILRGHLRSNVQYSINNSKTRNGAFGIKGWISSK